MNEKDVRQLFEKNKALLSGHFLLSSGLHSDTYFQSALVLQYPQVAETLAKELGKKITNEVSNISAVVSPALGGIVIGQEVARAIGARALFCERVEGKLVLRRGFTLTPGERCLLVEDVITTGRSTREVIEAVNAQGAKVAAVASLVDRSGGKVDFGVPRFSLLSLEVKSFSADQCAMCKGGSVPVKPGSRK